MTITDFFENDHAEIDAILALVRFDGGREDAEAFGRFDARLERHIDWEESLLFPAVSAKASQIGLGPVRVMLGEHEQIRAHKAAARKALEAGDGAAGESAVRAMLAVLVQHNRKEEHILYPACDQLLTAEEKERVLGEVAAAGRAGRRG